MTTDTAAALAANDLAHKALADVGRSLQRAHALNERAAAAMLQLSEMLTALVIPHRWAGTRLEIAGPEGWTTGPDLQGRPGAGTPGKSAYQLWLDEGNSGEIADYFAAQRGESFRPNAVGPGALRAQFDSRPADFAYLATDEERLYFRVGDEPGVWSDPVTFGRGEAGREVELGAGEEAISWRLAGDEAWRTLVSLQSLKGKDGREIELRATATHIQWRYKGDVPWQDMVAIGDLQAAADAAIASIISARDVALGAVSEAASSIVSARDGALGAISEAVAPIGQAVEDAQEAAGTAVGAAAQAQWSRVWADAPPDTPIDDGVNPIGYSARHHASKAAEAVQFDPDAYLTKSGNLGGLQDKAAARQNLDLKSAAEAEASAFATASQGSRADTALQAGALAPYARTEDLPGAATQSAPGLMTAADKAKLDGVSANARPGTVTSVGVTPPTGLTATGAVTASGTVTLTWGTGYRAYTDVEATKLAGLAAQVPADWTATTGPARVLNKPSTFPPSAHGHALADVTGLEAALAARAPLASPAFTGNPTVPTQAAGNASTRAANTKFVADAIAALVGAAPDLLNEIHEIAAALGNDPNFATTVTGLIAGKLSKSANLSDLTDVEAARLALQLGSAALQAATAFATAAQGTRADSAVQPGTLTAALGDYTPTDSLPAVARSGAYADLEGKPTIPAPLALALAAAVRAGSDTTAALGVAETWGALAPVTVNLTALDPLTFIHGTTTVSANTTVANLSNLRFGQSGWIRVEISGTRTISFGSTWRKVKDSPDPPTTGVFYLFYEIGASEVMYSIVEIE